MFNCYYKRGIIEYVRGAFGCLEKRELVALGEEVEVVVMVLVVFMSKQLSMLLLPWFPL